MPTRLCALTDSLLLNSVRSIELGDGYTEILRDVYPDIAETADFVMYWWHKAAEGVRKKRINRFGLITTNSIRQIFQRKVIEWHQNQKNPVGLVFAIPDHPWSDGGAAVRIAMTVGELEESKSNRLAKLGVVISEGEAQTPEDSADQVELQIKSVGKIFSNLQAGADITGTVLLQSNKGLCCPGMKLHGMGFCISQDEAKDLESEVINPYLNGRDLLQQSRNVSRLAQLNL
jgi:hypothetical protein